MPYQALTPLELEARYERMASVGRENANKQAWSLFTGWGEAPEKRTLLAAVLDENRFVGDFLEKIRFLCPDQYVTAGDHYPLHATIAQAEGVVSGEHTNILNDVLLNLTGATLDFNRLLVDPTGTILLCGTEIAPEFQEAREMGVEAFEELEFDPGPTPPILHVSLARPRVGFAYERYASRVLEFVGAQGESLWRLPTRLTVNGVYAGRTIDFLTRLPA